MKTIEQVLGGKKEIFSIDNIACMQHAEVIKSYQRNEELFIWSSQPKDIQLLFKIAFISICHQFNWDFLQEALAINLLNQPKSIVETLSEITASRLEGWLHKYPRPERIRAKERAHILRDIGKIMHEKFNNDIDLFYRKCSNSHLGDNTFYTILDNFEGYRTDPLRKKSNVLTHDLIKEHIVEFSDKENVMPAIDYHIMRLYVRSGRVVPSDEAIFKFLEGAPNPRGRLVSELRKAVSEAEQLTAFYANLSVADVNYIEWQIGRSICTNKEPACIAGESRIEIAKDVAALCKEKCPYQNTCLSFNQHRKFINFEEPKYISKDY
jgi:hypothetical protein